MNVPEYSSSLRLTPREARSTGRRTLALGLAAVAALGLLAAVAIAATRLAPLGHIEGTSAAQLYNLANVDAHRGALGWAILGYQRAALLAPRDGDIAANLAMARTQAGLPAPTESWIQHSVSFLSPSGWAYVWLAALWLLCAALAGVVLSKPARDFWIRTSLVGALAFVAGGAGFAVRNADLNAAVVTARDGADLQLSPFDGATAEARLREGESLQTDARHGSYLHVRVGDGHRGWVKSSAVESIVPGTS